MDVPSRTQRRSAARTRSRLAIGVGATCLVVTAAAVALAFLDTSPKPHEPGADAAQTTGALSLTLEESSTLGSPEIAPQVEVPDVRGKTREEAEMLLAYAGFVVTTFEAADPGDAAPGTVIRQDPRAGTLVAEGTDVALTLAPPAEAASEDSKTHWIVAIDPGHQDRSNLELEPIGPGSSVMKEKVLGGATGASTRIPEYETTLQICKVLEDTLSQAGIEVVMTRTTNDVDLSNSQRAQIANRAGADLFVRVHCDGSGDPGTHGASTLYPAGNPWVAPIAARSREAAELVQASLVEATAAADRGIVARDDITGFNWSSVPAVLVECGFLSNPAEDKLLSGADYRAKVARGIAAGVLAYLEGR